MKNQKSNIVNLQSFIKIVPCFKHIYQVQNRFRLPLNQAFFCKKIQKSNIVDLQSFIKNLLAVKILVDFKKGFDYRSTKHSVVKNQKSDIVDTQSLIKIIPYLKNICKV